MKISRLTFLALPLIAALVFHFLQIKLLPSNTDLGAQKLKLALNWVAEPEFGGFYAAQWQGFYKAAGLDVDIIPGGAGSPTIQMVAAGQVDLAISSASEVLISRERGSDVIATYGVYHTSPVAIMVHQSRGLQDLSQVFQGGTLAIQRGQAFSLFLEKQFGFSKIEIVPYTGGVGAFVHDKNMAQQCFAFSEPLLAEKENIPTQVFLLAEAGYNPYVEVVAMKSSFYEKNKDLVERFVRATRLGWQAYLKDPRATNKQMALLNKAMSPDTFEAIAQAQIPFIKTEDPSYILGTMSEARWTELANQLLELGLLKNKPNITKSFFNVDI